jgi:N-acetylglutamate synthase-like GNAT family acetyltransferase
LVDRLQLSFQVMDADSNRVEIRQATTTDAGAIASILLDAFEEYRPLYTVQGFAATTPTAEQILVRMILGPVWVALHNNTIVGTVSAVVEGESLYVRGMAVSPDARGLQLGESLLREIERSATEMNVNRLFLSTTPFLDRAIRLYRKFGFAQTDAGPHDLFGTPIFTMQKDLRRFPPAQGDDPPKYTK